MINLSHTILKELRNHWQNTYMLYFIQICLERANRERWVWIVKQVTSPSHVSWWHDIIHNEWTVEPGACILEQVEQASLPSMHMPLQEQGTQAYPPDPQCNIPWAILMLLIATLWKDHIWEHQVRLPKIGYHAQFILLVGLETSEGRLIPVFSDKQNYLIA